MSKRRLPPVTVYRQPPSTSQYAGSMPSRPTSSGAWLGFRPTIMRKDTDFIRADEALIRAKTAQTDAMSRLMEARIAAELVYSRLLQLPELKEHAYAVGRAQREHERAMFALNSEAERLLAQGRVAEARHLLARWEDPRIADFTRQERVNGITSSQWGGAGLQLECRHPVGLQHGTIAR